MAADLDRIMQSEIMIRSDMPSQSVIPVTAIQSLPPVKYQQGKDQLHGFLLKKSKTFT
jgi:hypothetical protein